MPVRDGAMPPVLMFRSFLTIACGVVCEKFIVGAVVLTIANFYFPEYLVSLAATGEPGDAFDKAQAFVPMPRAMLIAVAAISGALCLILGVFIGLTAPFGRFVHAIFLAVIVGVSYLSGSMAAPPEQKVVLMTYLLVLPLSILLGGYLINHKMTNYDLASSEKQPEMLGDDL